MKKKLILFALLALEIAVGSFVVFQYYSKKQMEKKILGVEKVAAIDSESVDKLETKNLKYFWQYKPNQNYVDERDWLKSPATYHINSDGINESQEFDIEKEASTFRIVALGDSFTFGHYVNTDENWTEQLEDLLNENSASFCNSQKIEIINLGVPGYDYEYIVHIYERIGMKYKPDLVLWFESDSGFYRFNEIQKPLQEKCYQQNPSAKEAEYASGIYACAESIRKEIETKYSSEYLLAKLTSHLERLYKLLPPKKLIYFTYDPLDKYQKQFEELGKVSSEATFIKLVPRLTENEMLPDGHPNRLGHTKIATYIYNYITNTAAYCN